MHKNLAGDTTNVEVWFLNPLSTDRHKFIFIHIEDLHAWHMRSYLYLCALEKMAKQAIILIAKVLPHVKKNEV